MTDTREILNVSDATGAPAPTEPFACPECGQMLAASCRVCVACKAPVDYARIAKHDPSPPIRLTPPASLASSERARFSWKIFLAVLFAYFLAATITTNTLGITGATYAMGGFVLVTSLWVFVDASEKGIPRSMVWAIGCLFMWIVMFPWYLSRRRTPQAPCPIVDGKAGPLARALFYTLMALIFMGAVLTVLNGPPPK